MSYGNGEIIEVLRAARQAKGLTQRDLSTKAGVPQSHISKIERGGADIRLSSLIELARALELELVLAPRHLLPAVHGILRSSPSQSSAPHPTYREITEALKILERLAAGSPGVEAFGKLQRLVRELGNARLSPLDLARIKSAVAGLLDVETPGDSHPEVVATMGKLSRLRDQLVDAARPAPKPAYSIEDDDDG